MATCKVCGSDAADGQGKPRSTDQLRRYFAMIRLTFDNWPEQHETQFSSQEDCRKTLQMMAGYREIGSRTKLIGIKPEVAVMLAQAAIGGAGAYARPVIHNGELIIWRPISIAFQKMSHEAFCALSDKVQAVIEAETGIRVADEMECA
jgi:hypothetical protein